MKFKNVYKIAVMLILIAIFTLFNEFNKLKEKEVKGIQATLSSCIDGDTAKFIINGNEEKVRFIGINAPELNEIPYGIMAKNYVCNILSSSKVIILQKEPYSADKDKYDRLLYWVFVDNKLLEEIIIYNGYGKLAYFRDNYSYIYDLKRAQKYAESNNLGIWAK